MGWLVLQGEYDPNAAPPPPQMAGIQMRAADGGNPMDPKPRTEVTAATIEEEERVAGTVAAHSAQTAQRNQQNYRRGAQTRAMPAGSVVVEQQDGVPVRTLNTPTKTGGDASRAHAAIAQGNAQSKIVAGAGQTREEMIAKMNDEERAQYASDVASRAAAYDADAPAKIVAQIQSTPKTVERDGMTVKNEVGGGTAIADLGGTGATPQTETVVEDGITFTRTKSPKAPVPVGDTGETADTARVIARSICRDFPDTYKFTDPIRKKIARLQADFDDRPDIIQAVAAADTDPVVRQRLIEEFPEAFNG